MKDDDDLTHETAQKLHSIIESMTAGALSAMTARGDRCPPHHLYVCLTAACAAIHTAAKIMTMPVAEPESEEATGWADGPPDRRAIVAAAMLLARCMLPSQTGMTLEINPGNVKAALSATEKVLGVVDTTIFSRPMVEAADKWPVPTNFLDNTRSDDSGDLSQNRILH